MCCVTPIEKEGMCFAGYLFWTERNLKLHFEPDKAGCLFYMDTLEGQTSLVITHQQLSSARYFLTGTADNITCRNSLTFKKKNTVKQFRHNPNSREANDNYVLTFIELDLYPVFINKVYINFLKEIFRLPWLENIDWSWIASVWMTV